jgi:hypothetical protein
LLKKLGLSLVGAVLAAGMLFGFAAGADEGTTTSETTLAAEAYWPFD